MFHQQTCIGWHRVASGRHREASRRILKTREFDDPTSERHREGIGKIRINYFPDALPMSDHASERYCGKVSNSWLCNPIGGIS